MSSEDESSVGTSSTPTKNKATKTRRGSWGKNKSIGKTVSKIFEKWVDSDRENGINPYDYTLQNFEDQFPELNLTDDWLVRPKLAQLSWE